jgi:hypothetical protein
VICETVWVVGAEQADKLAQTSRTNQCRGARWTAQFEQKVGIDSAAPSMFIQFTKDDRSLLGDSHFDLRAVLHITGQLTARGINVIASGFTNRCHQSSVL